MQEFREIEDTIRDRCGYGTLGHLVAVILCDRESFAGDKKMEQQAIDKAVDKADQIWDYIIAPALDLIEREIR